MAISLGVKIGQGREPSAVCAAEGRIRKVHGREAHHLFVRHLERLEAGMSLPAVGARVGEIVGEARRYSEDIEVFVDATGLGERVTDLIREPTH